MPARVPRARLRVPRAGPAHAARVPAVVARRLNRCARPSSAAQVSCSARSAREPGVWLYAFPPPKGALQADVTAVRAGSARIAAVTYQQRVTRANFYCG